MDGLDLAIVLFLAATVLSSYFGQDWRVSVLGNYQQPFHGIITIAIILSIYYGVKRTKHKSYVWTVIPWMAYPLTIYAVAQGLGYDFMPYPLPQGRATSFLGNPVYLGACYALMLPICLKQALNGSKMALVACFMVGIGLAMAQSKGSILAAFIGSLVLLWA